MNPGASDAHAIVVLPQLLPGGAAMDELLQTRSRWLMRGQFEDSPGAREALPIVLHALGVEAGMPGLAAMRLWGQTGERPDDWVCAADPVYLEALLDRLRLHALQGDILDALERAQLFDILQRELGNRTRRFVLIGECGYIRAEQAFATAAHSSLALHACETGEYQPAGRAAHDHDRLIGELQLLLHELPLNRERGARGLPPVNSLWLWGGGRLPPLSRRELPPLFAGDALFRGYWQYAGAKVNDFPTDFASLVTTGPTSYVAVLEANTDGQAAFVHLRRQLLRGRLQQLTVVSYDGRIVRLGRRQLFAFWRGRRSARPAGAAT